MTLLPFEEDIIKSLNALQAGGTILYPTDTVWGLGCDATDAGAVEKIYKIKRRVESKSMIILLDSLANLHHYVEKVPDITADLLSSIYNPVTVIYSGARNLAANVIAGDGTIGIRIVKDNFCRELITRFGKPIVSTSANISGGPTPSLFSQIPDEIRKETDYTVQHRQNSLGSSKPSTIIRLYESGSYNILRS